MEPKQNKKFSLLARIQSANHAARGIGLTLKTAHNAWGHVFFSILAVYLGFTLQISNTEWMFLTFSIGLVFITETFNSAMESNVDHHSPDYHPSARDTKDIAAGAVLIAVILSVVIACFIFLPKLS